MRRTPQILLMSMANNGFRRQEKSTTMRQSYPIHTQTAFLEVSVHCAMKESLTQILEGQLYFSEFFDRTLLDQTQDILYSNSAHSAYVYSQEIWDQIAGQTLPCISPLNIYARRLRNFQGIPHSVCLGSIPCKSQCFRKVWSWAHKCEGNKISQRVSNQPRNL